MKLSSKQFALANSILLTVVGILGAIVLAQQVYRLVREPSTVLDTPNPNTYQAVFLTNDQIYFGHLVNVNSPFPILLDVYYVRITQNETADGEKAKGQVIRLGEAEPHGPENKMVLNRDHVLFWEDLRSDSVVLDTIMKLKKAQ